MLSVIVRDSRVAKLKILMSYPPPDCAAYAISLSGAADHVARSALPSVLMRSRPVPSILTM